MLPKLDNALPHPAWVQNPQPAATTWHRMYNESLAAEGKSLSSMALLKVFYLFFFLTFQLIVENLCVYVKTKFTKGEVRRKNI